MGPSFSRFMVVQLAILGLVLLQACSTAPPSPVVTGSGLGPEPSSGPVLTTAGAARSAASAERGGDVALYAMSLLDRRYRFGGKSVDAGLDCSGLVSLVYREALGLEVRGSSAEIARQARPVPPPALQAGDLVFFNTLGQPRSHVGVYVGAGRFVHAANERKGVRIDRMDDRYYAARFEGAATLLD
jgi:cell wall-associated NlpC family hydrolase